MRDFDIIDVWTFVTVIIGIIAVSGLIVWALRVRRRQMLEAAYQKMMAMGNDREEYGVFFKRPIISHHHKHHPTIFISAFSLPEFV